MLPLQSFPNSIPYLAGGKNFEDGISAVIITRDDIWLDESLKSVENYVDELVMVDSSSKEYLNRNVRLVSELNIPEKTHGQGLK